MPKRESSFMADYEMPIVAKPMKLKKRQVQLIANGDLRASANERCWAAQAGMEAALKGALAAEGHELVRAHPYKEEERHGFIGSQKEGMEVFRGIDPEAPLI